MADPLNTARESVSLVGEIIKAAGDNPNVKVAGNNLGESAVTLTKTINNVLLPLAAVNFAFDKARAYFSEKFSTEMECKTREIPPDQIIEPKASIAGPALQGLAFTHEEPNLKEMYLNLLARAMDSRSALDVHPAFVEIIRQLNSEEADLLQGVLRSHEALPMVEVRLLAPDGGGWHVLTSHLLNNCDSASREPIENPRIQAMVVNWVRLGLAELDYTKHLSSNEDYDWVDQRPEVISFRKQHQASDRTILIQKGILVRTALGIQFANSVGIAS